jgi:hypothetical protein
MTDEPIYCPAQTYRATRDSPAEFCENEVDDYGDLCSEHDEDDRSDELYEQYLESKYDDEQDTPWGND